MFMIGVPELVEGFLSGNAHKGSGRGVGGGVDCLFKETISLHLKNRAFRVRRVFWLY